MLQSNYGDNQFTTSRLSQKCYSLQKIRICHKGLPKDFFKNYQKNRSTISSNNNVSKYLNSQSKQSDRSKNKQSMTLIPMKYPRMYKSEERKKKNLAKQQCQTQKRDESLIFTFSRQEKPRLGRYGQKSIKAGDNPDETRVKKLRRQGKYLDGSNEQWSKSSFSQQLGIIMNNKIKNQQLMFHYVQRTHKKMPLPFIKLIKKIIN